MFIRILTFILLALLTSICFAQSGNPHIGVGTSYTSAQYDGDPRQLNFQVVFPEIELKSVRLLFTGNGSRVWQFKEYANRSGTGYSYDIKGNLYLSKNIFLRGGISKACFTLPNEYTKCRNNPLIGGGVDLKFNPKDNFVISVEYLFPNDKTTLANGQQGLKNNTSGIRLDASVYHSISNKWLFWAGFRTNWARFDQPPYGRLTIFSPGFHGGIGYKIFSKESNNVKPKNVQDLEPKDVKSPFQPGERPRLLQKLDKNLISFNLIIPEM